MSWLLGREELDNTSSSVAVLAMAPTEPEGGLILSSDLRERLDRAPLGPGNAIYVHGLAGGGRTACIEALAARARLALLHVDGRAVTTDDTGLDRLLPHLIQATRLRGAAMCWTSFDILLEPVHAAKRRRLLRAIAAAGIPFAATGKTAWEPSGADRILPLFCIEVPRPSHAERLALWQRALTSPRTSFRADFHDRLATQFRFAPGQIRDAAATAVDLAQRSGNAAPDEEVLLGACRIHSGRALAKLGRKIEPRVRWDDVVLTGDLLEQLREICAQVRHRSLVLDNWGYARRLSRGRGLNVLFAGQSGTGKTMSAELLAGELGLDLYRIDLSSVVSKYIGETEKNLARIFDAAEASNAILFFDEADALFGKRSEIKDAHDRYANIEVSYLLQRMEELDGISILATNARSNMDVAFTRRLAFCLTFAVPDAELRRRIWERALPGEVPRKPDVDLAELASRFELAGGSIKNIALAASYLAAANGQRVGMEHLIRSTRREYQKIGKVCTRSGFGPWFALIDGDVP